MPSSDLSFSSTNRPRRGGWRIVGWTLAVVAGLALLWALLVAGLWAYAWFSLGADDIDALEVDESDDEPLGAAGGQAPDDAVTILVSFTGEVDPTSIREPVLNGSVALVQFGGPRDVPAVLLLPQNLPVSVDEQGELTLEQVQEEGGTDLMVETVADYTSVRIDHAVSFSIDALPRLVDAVGPLEVCNESSCDEPSGDDIRAELEVADDELQLATATSVLEALGERINGRFAVTSPLAAKRVVDVVNEEISTDVSLRGATLLSIASTLGAVAELDVDAIPMVINPDTGTVLPMEEPAMVRFQHLQEGTPLDGSGLSTDDLEADLVAGIEVAVLNGAGIDGLAGQAEVELEASGFVVIGTGNAPAFDRTDTVINFVGDDPVAEYVAGQIAEILDDTTLEPLGEPPEFESEPVDLLVTLGETAAE